MDLLGPDLRLRSAKLPGFPPFPTWNGTVSSPANSELELCSVLSSSGELVVLQSGRSEDSDALRVLKVLPPAERAFTTFCQCWVQDGSVLVAAYGRNVVFYATENFRVLQKLQLTYAVESMDVVARSSDALPPPSRSEYLLLVGTQFGAFLYIVSLHSVAKEVANEADKVATPVARAVADVAVSQVKFSPDRRTAAVGTFDGRLFLRGFASHHDDALTSFGIQILTMVLQDPRVTSISFSVRGTELAVATKHGSVYVFSRTLPSEKWQPLSSCKALRTAPKPKTGAQTLACCWGSVLVVCSRAVASRLEMYDFATGRLLHSLQLTAAAPTSSATLSQRIDQQLLTGVCSWHSPDGQSKLLCHDSDANVVVVRWPFLDAMSRR